jgi:galactose mutarotase-like enzyme
LDQLAGVRLVEFSDGKARGMRAAEVWTGGGLRFTIYLDRAMDVGPATFCGKPLAWVHPALGTPAQYEPRGAGFLRTFGGGLMTTCGLTHFGPPAQDEGRTYGLHGRVSHLPARNVCVVTGWEGDEYVLRVEGEVVQATPFGEYLVLRRAITTRLGARELRVEDHVRNAGDRETPHMMLYHCNFGFPVVSPGSRVHVPVAETRPRDEAARAGLDRWTQLGPPDPEFAEQVFFHTPVADAQGDVRAAIYNPGIDFGAYVRYRAAELPALTQWTFTSARDYVCALEPCTTHEAPRGVLRREARLSTLAPGEDVRYRLAFGVLDEAP